MPQAAICWQRQKQERSIQNRLLFCRRRCSRFAFGVDRQRRGRNLSKAERNELRIELAGYADDYRKGVIAKVAALKG